ncbi:TetR/AcrR family transcriptional regulator [Sphingomonas aliaeris]|uniref:TetR/AcrR family transcriptional regulator n=1 Tax=Sphingomonas aliaeris TaxID=2759526 RepID=A0A974NTN3_9SPHN|nr:TetR/AcrR family transcriptional regulator [Sphingomonas aliaeris]QQV76726.1 TetR/AcrR family transcriptional regulator [Sphingomonas aliaeris]
MSIIPTDPKTPGAVGQDASCIKLGRAEVRREKVIATARTLFAEQGFHNTGIAQIAKHSGVLVGQLYRDFAKKEDIVAAIVSRDLELFLAESELREATIAHDLHAVRDWVADFIACPPDDKDMRLIADIMAEAQRNDRIATIVSDLHERLRGTIATALAAIVPDARKDRQRLLLTEMILTISAGSFHRRLAQNGVIDPVVTAALTDMVGREIDALIAA